MVDTIAVLQLSTSVKVIWLHVICKLSVSCFRQLYKTSSLSVTIHWTVQFGCTTAVCCHHTILASEPRTMAKSMGLKVTQLSWLRFFSSPLLSPLFFFFGSFQWVFLGLLDWIVLILVWFERSLHRAQVSWQSCSWPLKLMTSQLVEGMWSKWAVTGCTGTNGSITTKPSKHS